MRAFQILAAVLALFTLVWFVLYERRRSTIVSKSERNLAFGWLVFRRIACFTTAALFGLLAISVLFDPKNGSSFSSLAGQFLSCALVSFVAAWVGIYGGGRRKLMSDDRAIHKERKRRYGWKW
jgi:hypothetical protein